MSLKDFIKNEVEIAKFKLSRLDKSGRRYKARLADTEREFLRIDFAALGCDESGAREAVKLFRASRALFYLKHKDQLISSDKFLDIKKSTLNRKRYLVKKSNELSSGYAVGYNNEINNLFSYSDIIKKRQIARFECGTKSLGKYISDKMNDIYKDITELNSNNILYARSLIDGIALNLRKKWYLNYNYILSKESFGKIKPLIVAVDRPLNDGDVYDDGYRILINIKKIGNEHMKIACLDLTRDGREDMLGYSYARLSGDIDGHKAVRIKRLNENSSELNPDRVRVLVPGTRSESISLDSLGPIIGSVCSLISEEYHSF